MGEDTDDGLAGALADYSFAYLMTVTADGRAHAVAVQPRLVDGGLEVPGVGNRSRSNVSVRPEVSLVWPPRDFDGYSLIVNGAAADSDESGVTVTPTRAVLHRPHDHESHREAAGCGSDCMPIDLTPRT